MKTKNLGCYWRVLLKQLKKTQTVKGDLWIRTFMAVLYSKELQEAS